MQDETSFDKALNHLDALHGEDPRTLDIDGQSIPLELWHAKRMTAWLEKLLDAPDELTRIAVRSQHLQRWQVPRKDYPEGLTGYLTWRRDQGHRAGETAAAVMQMCGYAAQDARRVAQMIRKQGLGHDAGAQAVEDCACLVFLENYFADFSRQIERNHLVNIVRKTWNKMSPAAQQLALRLPMDASTKAIVEEALAS